MSDEWEEITLKIKKDPEWPGHGTNIEFNGMLYRRIDLPSEREKKLREAVRDLLKSMEQIRALTYNPTYESTGLEFGIATDALKKHADTIKGCGQ